MIVNIIKTILEISFFALLLLPLTACGPQQQQPSGRGKQLVKAATAYKTSQLVKPQPTVTVVAKEHGDLVSVTSECVWDAARSGELPSLPAKWLEYPELIAALESQQMATPQELHELAKFKTSGLSTLEEITDQESLILEDTGRVNHLLQMHNIFCGEPWQGEEATKVVGRDDLVSAVAECVWRVAQSDGLPRVPTVLQKDNQSLTPEFVKSQADHLAGAYAGVVYIDRDIRLSIEAGTDIATVERWHHIFCGTEWEN